MASAAGALSRYVPRDLIERPKMGFGVPLASWLRGPLRQWAESLLDETHRLEREGYFHPGTRSTTMGGAPVGKRNWQYHFWNVLMFQAWIRAVRACGHGACCFYYGRLDVLGDSS